MIHIKRYHDAPECLDNQLSYKCGEVVGLLEEEFLGKCYLCETDQFSINVEHFIPHGRRPEYKYNWHNLYYACDHCNSLKGQQHILDCTDPQHDVENRLVYRTAYFPWHEVRIEENPEPPENWPGKYNTLPDEAAEGPEIEGESNDHVNVQEQEGLQDAAKEAEPGDEIPPATGADEELQELTGATVELLNRIFNGSTRIKTKGAAKLKHYLISEMIRFQDLILQYEKNKFNKPAREKIEADIAAELHRGSKLTAFKRQIIKDFPAFREQFLQYFD